MGELDYHNLAGIPPQERIEIFLQNAWHWGNLDIANAILDLAPLISKANIYTACVCGDVDAVNSFLEGSPELASEAGGPHNRTPIVYSTWSCYLSKKEGEIAHIIEKLISCGANPNSAWTNENGTRESALYGCVEAKSLVVAEKLVAAKADPNDGESLYHACEKNSIELLDLLANGHLDPEDISYCIKHAMDFRWDDGIRWFLDKGADPNAVHPVAKETSLHWAVKRNCSVEIITDLINAGADLNARTTTGQSAFLKIVGHTPLDFALRLGRKDVVTLLKARGAKESVYSEYDQFVIGVVNSEDQDEVKNEKGMLGSLTENDQNLISHVSQMQNWGAVRKMIEIGWPIDGVGWMGATPLYWALAFGETLMVQYLLQHGASTDEIGGYFKNPIHTVISCQWGKGGDWTGSLACLLKHGLEIPSDVFPSGQSDLDGILRRYL